MSHFTDGLKPPLFGRRSLNAQGTLPAFLGAMAVNVSIFAIARTLRTPFNGKVLQSTCACVFFLLAFLTTPVNTWCTLDREYHCYFVLLFYWVLYIYIYTVSGSSWSRQECDDGPSGSGECSCMAGQEAGGCL